MLSGKQAFAGEDVSHTLAAVIMKEPDWEALPASTGTSIRQLLRRCLTKDPKQRLQAIGEARIAIEEAVGGASQASLEAGLPRRARDARVAETQIRSVAADGTGKEQTIIEVPIGGLANDITADGKTLIYSVVVPNAGFDIRTLALDSATCKAAAGATPQPLVEGPGNQFSPALSPDGRFLAYTSNESGSLKVYLTTFPWSGAKWQVSPQDGLRPVWNRSGTRLYYVSDQDGAVMEVDVKTQPVVAIGTPQRLFDTEASGIRARSASTLLRTKVGS